MIVPRERPVVPPTPVQLERILLVEGETPSHFFEALAKDVGVAERIEIRSYGGIQQLSTFLKTLASTAEFRKKVRSLGIARDAEDDADAARRSVDHAVREARLSNVSVNVEILPTDGPGMIETLCVRSIETHPAYDCVSQFLGCLTSGGVGLPSGPILAKHTAQAYLIAVNWPQLMPGLAAHKGAWPFSSPVFDRLKAFLLGL